MKREATEVRDVLPEYGLETAKLAVPAGYKQSEMGTIPHDWEVRTFGQHFCIYAGGDSPTESLSRIRSEKHPFPIYANAIQKKGLYGFTSHARSKSDSLTITARGYLGHAEYRDEAFFPIVRLLVLEPIGFLDARYTTYAINERVAFYIESTGVPQLTAPQVGKYAVAAPPTLDEQRAIATALSDVDALLEELDRLIAKKRDLKQAAMQQLLTGQTRLPGFEGEWEAKSLGDVLRVRHGRSQRDIVLSDGKFPIWATGGEIGRTDTPLHREPSVLIGRKGTIDAPRYADSPFWTVDTLFYTEILGQNSAKYLFYRFCMISWKNYNEASGVPSLNAKTIESIELNLPAPEEQRAIAIILSDMDAEIETLDQRRAKTAALKQAMMQELLTGMTRLVDPAVQDEPAEQAQPSGRKANVYFIRSVLAAEIVDQLHEEPTFGHVKFEKMLFLVEHLCDVDTGSTYHRKAAGPYDNRALRSIDSQLQKQQWFEARKEDGRYRYVPLDRRGNHKTYFDRYFADVSCTFQQVLDTFRHVDTERCEIVATLFAAWRDLLRDQPRVSDETIVHEVLNNWHESKQRIPADRWLKALAWMRALGFVPKGGAS